MKYHILWIFVSSLLFVCLYTMSVRAGVGSPDAALALAPGQQPWDSHSGRTLIQALALTQALTLTALF